MTVNSITTPGLTGPGSLKLRRVYDIADKDDVFSRELVVDGDRVHNLPEAVFDALLRIAS